MKKEEIELTMSSDYKNLAIIRSLVRTYLDIEKISKADSVQLISAVDELSTNVMEHAYEDDETSNKIIKVYLGQENDVIFISVEDFGKGFSPDKKSKMEGGLGLNIVAGVVDDLKLVKKDIGTRIELLKKVKKEEE